MWKWSSKNSLDPTRPENPWHLTDGHGNSSEPTGGHVWSTPGHRWERLFRIPSMPFGGPPVENLWPPVENDNFRSYNLVRGTFECREKITCNLAGNFAITFSGKAITQSKVPNSTIFEDLDAGLISNDAAGWIEEKYFGIESSLKSRFREISCERHIAIFKKSVWENHFNPKILLSTTKCCDALFVSDWIFAIWWPSLSKTFLSTPMEISVFWWGNIFP